MTVVDDFAADYFVREGLTLKRQRDVRRALAELEAFAGAAPELLEDQTVRAWVTHLVGTGLHVNTVRKKLHAVKPFYKWAWQKRIVDADRFMRMRDVEPPRGATGRSRPRPYRRQEVQRFWGELDARWPLTTPYYIDRWQRSTSRWHRVWRHAMHLQVQAIASLALFGGLRNQEIRLAGIDEIHPDNDFIVVSKAKSAAGHAQGFREVPYTEQGREMVGRWLEFRSGLIRPDHHSPWLVLNPAASPNNHLAPSHPFAAASQTVFEAFLPSVGKWELHRFRHTCATEWLRAGVELERVSKLLGHANLQQTLAYAELVRDDVARSTRAAEQDFVTAVGRRHQQLVG